jgi:hypothetical protein
MISLPHSQYLNRMFEFNDIWRKFGFLCVSSFSTVSVGNGSTGFSNISGWCGSEFAPKATFTVAACRQA